MEKTVKVSKGESANLNNHAKNIRNFLYKPYAENGDAVLLLKHVKDEDVWELTGVDVPTKECPEWSFWKMVSDKENGIDETDHDLTEEEMEEIKNFIRHHKDLAKNICEPSCFI